MVLIDLQTIFEIASAFLYCFVFLVIISSKLEVFRTAFFFIFIATGIADVISIFVNGFARLNRQLKLGPEYRHIASFCVLMSGVTFIIHMIGNLIIAFNRYSAVYLPRLYDEIWKKRNIWIMAIFEYVIAFVALYHTIGAHMVYIQNADGSYTFIGLEKNLDVINRFTYFGVCLIYSLTSVAINALLLYGFKNLPDTDRNTHHEKGLFFYTLIVFVFSLLMCAQQIGKLFTILAENLDLFLWISIQFFWINDVMVCIPPVSLLVFCSDLRQDSIELLRCRRNQRNVVQPFSPDSVI